MTLHRNFWHLYFPFPLHPSSKSPLIPRAGSTKDSPVVFYEVWARDIKAIWFQGSHPNRRLCVPMDAIKLALRPLRSNNASLTSFEIDFDLFTPEKGHDLERLCGVCQFGSRIKPAFCELSSSLS